MSDTEGKCSSCRAVKFYSFFATVHDTQASYHASEPVAVYGAGCGTLVHQSPPATEAKLR